VPAYDPDCSYALPKLVPVIFIIRDSPELKNDGTRKLFKISNLRFV